MRIHQVGGLGLDSNIYLIADEIVALIDAGTGQHQLEVESNMRELGFGPGDIDLILNTHCHYDHVGGDHAFVRASGCGVAIHELDGQPLREGDAITTCAVVFGVELEPLEPAQLLREGERIELGELTLEVLHTPGHTRGSVCFYGREQRVLFSGDTVFCGGVGRVDLPTSDGAAMANSLRRLASLEVEELFPGHGPSSKKAKAHIHRALTIFKQGRQSSGNLDGCGSMGPREVLNKLKWDPSFKLEDAEVTILHRGAPGEARVFRGSDILELGSGFMRVSSPEGEVSIPYHRILRIEARGRVLWEKRG